MTDKEIIIDGVNVSGCSELFKTTQRPQCALIDQYYCETNPDCYYKQLKRLEQENAELKAYMDVNEDFKTAWEELKAENEKLREDYIKLSQQKDLDNLLNHWQNKNLIVKEQTNER